LVRLAPLRLAPLKLVRLRLAPLKSASFSLTLDLLHKCYMLQ
jgi:hypothetical protein